MIKVGSSQSRSQHGTRYPPRRRTKACAEALVVRPSSIASTTVVGRIPPTCERYRSIQDAAPIRQRGVVSGSIRFCSRKQAGSCRFEREYTTRCKPCTLEGALIRYSSIRRWAGKVCLVLRQHPNGTRWIGYRAGTYLVDRAMRASGKSAADLVAMPTEDLLRLAQSPSP